MADGARASRLAKLAAGQLGIFLALLVVADLALWLVAPIDDDGPTEFRFSQTIDGLKPDILVRTIGYGIRSASMQNLAKPTGSVRILCLGASTTAQPTQNDDDTWCAQLESKLRATPQAANLSLHAVSYGHGGARAIDTAIWINRMFDIVKPDIVVTLLGFNDVAFGGGPNYRIRDVNKMVESDGSLGRRIRRLCVQISQTCRRLTRASDDYYRQQDMKSGRALEWHSASLPKLRKAYRDENQIPFIASPVRTPDPIEEFRNATAWIFRFLRERGASVVALGQPVLLKPELTPAEFNSLWFTVFTPNGEVRSSSSWLLNEMRRFNRAQQEEAEKIGARYLDLESVVSKSLDYFFDDCHFIDKGSAQVAEMVLPVLRQALSERQR